MPGLKISPHHESKDFNDNLSGSPLGIDGNCN